MADQLKDRVRDRLDVLGINAFEAARRMGDKTGRDFVSDILKGRKNSVRGDKLTLLAKALETDTAFLLAAADAPKAFTRIIGRVGANPDGSIIYTSADEAFIWVELTPGVTSDAVALEVLGHSMHTLADDGSLIFFESQHTPPTADMLGEAVVVETEDGQVLLKRLLRGSAPGLYDLASINGPTLRDQRVVWAAEITAIVPPRAARRLLKREDVAA
ncbi:MAG: hypothetical protein JWP92_1799 [Caulobacter sp.]|nr:hypothetical protein [Caulobacter sp.]